MALDGARALMLQLNNRGRGIQQHQHALGAEKEPDLTLRSSHGGEMIPPGQLQPEGAQGA